MDAIAQLATQLGFALGYLGPGDDYKVDEDGIDDTLAELVDFNARILPSEIDTTLRDMQRFDARETPEGDKLLSFIPRLEGLAAEQDRAVVRRRVFLFLEIYHHLEHCNQLALQKQMDGVLAKYVAT